MHEFCRNLHLVQEIFVGRAVIRLRNLQRDPLVQNRIRRFVDVGKRTGRDATENAVFAKLLSGS